MSDAEWSIIEPLIPPPKSGGSHSGKPQVWPLREILNAIFYLLRTGCSWRQLPSDLPPWRTVYHYFRRWSADGVIEEVHNTLRESLRQRAGRNIEPSAGIIDAQSTKGTDTVGKSTRGYDAGKKTNGRKRHIIVDTTGLLLMIVITAANIQDRDGAKVVTEKLHKVHPELKVIWADGGYRGKFIDWAKEICNIVIDVVYKKDGQHTFEVLPTTWVVERSFAWITKCRRLVVDYERRTAHSEAMVQMAMIGIMLRRLARLDPEADVTGYNWPTK